jgi:hypothetical protein
MSAPAAAQTTPIELGRPLAWSPSTTGPSTPSAAASGVQPTASRSTSTASSSTEQRDADAPSTAVANFPATSADDNNEDQDRSRSPAGSRSSASASSSSSDSDDEDDSPATPESNDSGNTENEDDGVSFLAEELKVGLRKALRGSMAPMADDLTPLLSVRIARPSRPSSNRAVSLRTARRLRLRSTTSRFAARAAQA